MNVLLDTHAFIWFLNGDAQLDGKVKDIIADTSNKCLISMASIWEMAIKSGLGKLELTGGFENIASFAFDNEIEILPITFEHLLILNSLDVHHRDPFDRLIIAQALSEKLIIASIDSNFRLYPVDLIWS
ncbi:MAG: type II toxin-antitoxin system VapC family toxin [Taibaiella sp.]|nr:type II toxin-antitoxin system VapC family toxin [Taibaiella sp.]